MIFQRVSPWIMIATAVGVTAVSVWVFMGLMRTRALKRSVLTALPFGAALLIISALVKRNSANHAILLWDDAMLLLLTIALVLLPQERRLRREAAKAGTDPPPLSAKAGSRAAWVGSAVLLFIIIGEYALAAIH